MFFILFKHCSLDFKNVNSCFGLLTKVIYLKNKIRSYCINKKITKLCIFRYFYRMFIQSCNMHIILQNKLNDEPCPKSSCNISWYLIWLKLIFLLYLLVLHMNSLAYNVAALPKWNIVSTFFFVTLLLDK